MMSGMSTKVRWGVLSTAAIGVKKVIPAMQKGEWSEVTAIASRDTHKAEAVAQALGIARAYGSYEELLADPQIEAIYNPLPNQLHVPWSIKAAEAGKHVLCEKPLSLTVSEARTLLAVQDRTGLKMGEAFMVRTHPQWLRARELVKRDPVMKVDRLTSAILDFPSGQSTFTCSTQLVPYQRMQFLGTKGRIEIEIPFNAPNDRPCRIFIDDGGELFGSGITTESFPTCNQYTVQRHLFSKAVRDGGEVPGPLGDAVKNMAVIEAIFRSAESGRWETP